MKGMVRSLLFLLLVLLAGCAQPGRLAEPGAACQLELDALFDTPELAHATVAALFRRSHDRQVLYERGAGQMLTPASVLKLVTVAVAAEQLGWDAHFETRLYATGPVRDGVLHGDLVVVGGGDPTLGEPGGIGLPGQGGYAFARWAALLERLGVREVRGAVRVEQAAGLPGWGRGWMWDDWVYPFSAPLAAANFAENRVALHILPGTPPRVEGPLAAALPVVAGTVVQRDGAPGRVRLAYRPGGVLEITGEAPAEGVRRQVALLDPAPLLAAALHGWLEAQGIRIRGGYGTADARCAEPARGCEPLDRHHSATLAILSGRLLGVSQNLYAEALYQRLGGESVLLAQLAAWGIETRHLRLADGSGLSRYSQLSATALVDLLDHLQHTPHRFAPMACAMPSGGQPGTTLAHRFRTGDAVGRVRAKSGSMTGVRALAGVVQSPNGPVSFAVLVNHHALPPAQVDALIDRAVERVSRGCR